MVQVVRSPGGWPYPVPESDLQDLLMTDHTGGVPVRLLPRIMLSALITCDLIDDEDKPTFGHSCRHGPGPHTIRVLIRKGDNAPSTYKRLREQAKP